MSEENAVREPAIDKSSGTVYSWLHNVPASDNNFTGALDRATPEIIEEVLKDLPEENTKTKRKILEARLRKLNRNK